MAFNLRSEPGQELSENTQTDFGQLMAAVAEVIAIRIANEGSKMFSKGTSEIVVSRQEMLEEVAYLLDNPHCIWGDYKV